MAHGRFWIGFGFLLTTAGAAVAQGTHHAPGVPGGPPPAFLPGGPPTAPPSAPPGVATIGNGGQSIQAIAALSDEHAHVKELPSGLPELIPAPDKHHGHGEHHVEGFMTPFVPEHGGWYTQGEFLLQRPRNTDLDFTIINRGGAGLGTIGPIESFRYELGTGLRAEVGHRWGEGKWETAFAYTYLTAGTDRAITAGVGQNLLPTLTRPGLTDRASTASGNVDLDYQLFDMIAGRRVLHDEHFALRYIGGFRFTDIRQILNVNYDGIDARQARIASRSRFQGFGPLVGVEGVLVHHKGFHVYTRAIGGLLTGRSTNRLIETNDAGATAYVNTQNDVRKVVPYGSFALGGGWQYRSISLRGGWEVTHYEGLFERPRFTDDVGQGKVNNRPSNLTLEGFFVQVALSY